MNNFALVREVSRAGLIVLGRLSHVLTRTLLAQFNLGLLLHTIKRLRRCLHWVKHFGTYIGLLYCLQLLVGAGGEATLGKRQEHLW